MGKIILVLINIAFYGYIIYRIVKARKNKKREETQKIIEEYHPQPTPRKYTSQEEAVYCEQILPTYLAYFYPHMENWKFTKYYPTYCLAMTNEIEVAMPFDKKDNLKVTPELVKDVVDYDEAQGARFNKAKYWLRKGELSNSFEFELTEAFNSGQKEYNLKTPDNFEVSDTTTLARLLEEKYPLLSISPQGHALTIKLKEASTVKKEKPSYVDVASVLKGEVSTAKENDNDAEILEKHFIEIIDAAESFDMRDIVNSIIRESRSNGATRTEELLELKYSGIVSKIKKNDEVLYNLDGVEFLIKTLADTALYLAKYGNDKNLFIDLLIVNGWVTDETTRLAQEYGDAETLYDLAQKYLLKEDVEFRDYGLAFKLLERSAKGECALAYGSLGKCYEEGLGTKIDYQRAGDFYMRAIELGADEKGFYHQKVDELYVGKKWDKGKYDASKLFSNKSVDMKGLRASLKSIQEKTEKLKNDDSVSISDKASLLRKYFEESINEVIRAYQQEHLDDSLMDKIDVLDRFKIIPSGVADGCHSLRKLGNKALHNAEGEKISPEEVEGGFEALASFFEVFAVE